MVTDHTGVNKQATDLVKKLNVKPEDNPTSQSLKQGGEANIKNLRGPQATAGSTSQASPGSIATPARFIRR